MSLTNYLAIAEKSILDEFGRQTYLGNAFVLPALDITLTSTSETSLVLIQNPSSQTKSIFCNLRRFTSTAESVEMRLYSNPTVAADAIQTVTTVADSSGSLNSKYFTFYTPAGVGYYVWANINSAGVDPAPAGLTGIEWSGATNVSANNAATAIKNAIVAAAPVGITATSGTDIVTLTATVAGPVKLAADSSAATDFAFALTAGLGTPSIPVNCRTASATVSISACYANGQFVVSANGTLMSSIGVPTEYITVLDNALLIILDPGQSMLITGAALTEDTVVNSDISWYEI